MTHTAMPPPLKHAEFGGTDMNPPDRPAAAETGNEPPRPEPVAHPPWSMAFVRHAAVWLVVAIAGGLFLSRLADSLAHRLAGIFQMILVSLFLSFAIEPAVGYLAPRGWRRGGGTAAVF